MHIRLFISEHAHERHRLGAALKDALPDVPMVQYPSIGSIGWMTPGAINGTVVAVIMVTKIEELVMLATWQSIWERIKTILVLPDSNSETVTLGHALRPRYITFADRGFSDVVTVLNHMRKSPNGDIDK